MTDTETAACLRMLCHEVDIAVEAIRAAMNGHPSPRINRAFVPLLHARQRAGEVLSPPENTVGQK